MMHEKKNSKKRSNLKIISDPHGQIPPQAITVEESVLGVLLLESNSFNQVRDILFPSVFYDEANMLVYKAIEGLHKKELEVDMLTLVEELKYNGNLDKVGGIYHISQYTDKIVSTRHIRRHAMILRDKYMYRKLITLAYEMQRDAFSGKIDISYLLDRSKKSLVDLSKITTHNFQRILDYEGNIIKNSFHSNTVFSDLVPKMPMKFFNSNTLQLIWNAMFMLYDKEVPISLGAIKDILSDSGNQEHTEKVEIIISKIYPDESNWLYQFNYLMSQYDVKRLEDLKDFMDKNMRNPELIKDEMDKVLTDVSATTEDIISMAQAQRENNQELEDRIEGRSNDTLFTGNHDIDEMLGLALDTLLLVGGTKGSGKTRFIIYLMTILLKNDSDVAIYWNSMEDGYKKIISCMYSVLTEIDSSITMGKIKPTEAERDMIIHASKIIESWDVEFDCKPQKVTKARAKFKRFVSKREGKKCIAIIDNIMMLQDDKGTQDKTDTFIAKQLALMRSDNNQCVIALHHFSKAQELEDRLDVAYRPKDGDLRGSSRYADISNIIVLINRPAKYKDLLAEEIRKPAIMYRDKLVARSTIIENLFITEKVKDRDGPTEEEKALKRWIFKHGNLSLKFFN